MKLRARPTDVGMNLLLLFGVMFPVWFFTMWGVHALEGHNLSDGPFLAFVYSLLTASVPLLVGGVAQQGILALIPENIPRWRRRLLGVLSSLLLLASLVLFQHDSASFLQPDVAGPLLVSLVLYGLIVRLPPAEVVGARH